VKRVVRIAGFVVLGLAAAVVVGLGVLVGWPGPTLRYPQQRAPARQCHEAQGVRCFSVRDGARLAGRFESLPQADTVVLFLHGVRATGAELEASARALGQATGANVIRLDLRGHGLSEGTPGDLTHRWQYEEDVVDVLATLRREHPSAKLVLAGHSMGGGIALATWREKPALDAMVLFAPLLGEQAPATQRHSSSAATEPSVLQLSVPRLVGVGLFTLLGVHWFDARPVLFFDLPDPQRVQAYSFRAVASMAPDDLPAALTADERPLLTLVGEHDEAFVAEAYPRLLAQHRNATTQLIAGATHEGVLVAPDAIEAVRAWLAQIK
jgi:alpha-beta hydrolase superfamily lysophospholipase